MHYRNITYRLHPKTKCKAETISKCLGATRYVWNHFLAENKKQIEAHSVDCALPRPSTSFFSLGKDFTQLRSQTDWLKDLPFAPIRYTLKYQADAWNQCFRSGNGFPKFKSRQDNNDSVTFPKGTFRLNGGCLHLQKVGQVVLQGNNPYKGCETKLLVIRKRLDKFYATVCYEVAEDRIAKVENGKLIGIDMNVGQFATSEREVRRMPELDRLEARHRRYQRIMARRQKPKKTKTKGGRVIYTEGSGRYKDTRQKCAKVSRKIKNIRCNWQHQESRRIANKFQYSVVENLNTKVMTKSAKGDAENPGTNVRAKSELNREILNTGWRSLRQKLAYKTKLVEVNPKNTSRMCYECQHIDKENRRTQSKFKCVSCGHSDNADINAALNISALGIRAIGCGRGVCVSNLSDPSRTYGDVACVY